MPSEFRPYDSCVVVAEGCTRPPALVPKTRAKMAECFRCGNTVCANCSRRRQYLWYGRKRLCLLCTDELDRA